MPTSGTSLVAALRAAVGDEALGADPAPYRIAGLAPAVVVCPRDCAQVSAVMRVAQTHRLAVVPTGNGTHLHVGSPPARYDVALSLRRLDRIVAHEAADLTVTADAGVPLGALNTALGKLGQWLPIDPPQAKRVTVGGLIAGDLNGPLRWAHGKVRDLLIGITVVLADGTVVKSGGRVVKNVAGYDLGKLFSGSLGTLAVIVEATFKIRPRPAHSRVAWLPAADLNEAAQQAVGLLDTAIAPSFVEVLGARAAAQLGATQPAVALGLSGSDEEIAAQHTVVRQHYPGARLCDDAEGVRVAAWLREFPAGDTHAMSARVSLLPTQLAALLPRIAAEAGARELSATVVAHAGNGIARVGFSGQDSRLVLVAEWLRLATRELGGWVTFDRLPDALHGRVDPFGNPSAAVLLMRALKREFDPHNCLSPGRFVAGI